VTRTAIARLASGEIVHEICDHVGNSGDPVYYILLYISELPLQNKCYVDIWIRRQQQSPRMYVVHEDLPHLDTMFEVDKHVTTTSPP